MKDPLLIYPVIFQENTDEDGHYFTVTSPNIPGMVTEGNTRTLAAKEAIDAIATMLDGESYPRPQDPGTWPPLAANESIVYITLDMAQWQAEKVRARKLKTVRRTITLPEYLNDFAKESHVNVSRLATEALESERAATQHHGTNN